MNESTPRFSVADGLEEFGGRPEATWKLPVYFFARPLLSRVWRGRLAVETRRALKPALVLGSRGFPLASRRRWATAGHSMRERVLLVQGTGTGWDVVSWAARRPAKIIATDLFELAQSWERVAAYCRDRFGVDVTFRQAPLESHAFLPDQSVDVCGSDAVLEHCKDLRAVMKESYRVLKPNGYFYATYGPLWFSAGGDHFSGRGGLDHVFDHVLLGDDDYREYFRRHKQPVENYQSGGRYVELDLFSGLATREYLAIFDETGFEVESLGLEVSADALAFRRAFPARFDELIRKYADRCTPDDFVIKANYVRLRKRQATTRPLSASRGVCP